MATRRPACGRTWCGALAVIADAHLVPDPEAITPRVTWNDEPWTETTIPHALLLGGGVLRFERSTTRDGDVASTTPPPLGVPMGRKRS